MTKEINNCKIEYHCTGFFLCKHSYLDKYKNCIFCKNGICENDDAEVDALVEEYDKYKKFLEENE